MGASFLRTSASIVLFLVASRCAMAQSETVVPIISEYCPYPAYYTTTNGALITSPCDHAPFTTTIGFSTSVISPATTTAPSPIAPSANATMPNSSVPPTSVMSMFSNAAVAPTGAPYPALAAAGVMGIVAALV